MHFLSLRCNAMIQVMIFIDTMRHLFIFSVGKHDNDIPLKQIKVMNNNYFQLVEQLLVTPSICNKRIQ